MANNLTEEVNEYFRAGGRLESSLDGFEAREGQLIMAEGVSRCLRERNTFLVEAPTGIGKTIAYLIPVILSDMTVVVSTGTKNLQDQIYYRDLPRLLKALGINIAVCYIKGRSNYLCQRRFQSAKESLKEQKNKNITRFLDWVEETKTGDREEMDFIPDDWVYWKAVCSGAETCYGQKCAFFSSCFVTLLRKKAFASKIIVTNHYLFFADLAIKEVSNGEVIPPYEAVVLDEGHHIEKVASHYFGFTLSNYRVDELRRDIIKSVKDNGLSLPELEQARKDMETEAFGFFSSFPALKNEANTLISRVIHAHALNIKSEQLSESLKKLASTINKFTEKSEDFPALQRRSVELATTLEFIINGSDQAFVYWLEKRGKGIFLHATPIDISEKLSTTLFQEQKPVIISSATLTTEGKFDYFKENLGITESKYELCPSNFDYLKQSLIFVPKNLPEPSHPDFLEKSCEVLQELMETTKGRALILCTSKRNMENMYHCLAPKLDFPCLIQGKLPKTTLLKKFREQTHSILFATGSFWEGVDIPGETLSCVVIDKLPFESPYEPMVDARINYIKKSGKNPFKEYQVPKAVIALRQGFGRLIRGKMDRGVFTVLDSRILSRYYGKTFIKSLPECRQVSSIEEVCNFINTKE